MEPGLGGLALCETVAKLLASEIALVSGVLSGIALF
jgi:hypothetical protein